MKSHVFIHLMIFVQFVKYSDAEGKLTNKQIYENLKKSLKFIKESCGEICDQTITGKPGKYFDHITVGFSYFFSFVK